MWIVEAYPYDPEEELRRLKSGLKPPRILIKSLHAEAQKLWDDNPSWSERRLAKELRISHRALQLLNLTPPPGREKYAKKRHISD